MVDIKKFIKSNVNKEIEERGEALFHQHKVSLTHYSGGDDLWVFKVIGSKPYQVKISGVDINNIRTQCSCPYDWGPVCKHTVACLLYVNNKKNPPIAEDTKTQQPTKTSNYRRTGDFEITDYKNITREYVRNNCDPNIFDALVFQIFNIRIKNTFFKESEIIFDLYYGSSNYQVKIFKKKNKYYINSQEETLSNGLKMSEAALLFQIATSPEPDLIDVAFSKEIRNYKKKKLEDFGFDKNGNFDEYFTLTFDAEFGLQVRNSPKLEGIIPVKSEAPSSFSVFVSKIIGNEDIRIKLPDIADPKNKRELGFVFRQIYSHRAKEKMQLKFTIITGKLDKKGNKISTNIKEFEEDNYFDIHYTENNRQLIKLSDVNYREWDRSQFQHFSQMLDLLAEEKFVYVAFPIGYNIKKDDLIEMQVSKSKISIEFNIYENDLFINAKIQYLLEGEVLDPKEIDLNLTTNDMIAVGNIFYPILNFETAAFIMEYDSEIKMAKGHREHFFNTVIQPLSAKFNINFSDGIYDTQTINLDFNKKQVFLSEQDEYLIIQPRVVYGEELPILLSATGNIVQYSDNQVITYGRNFDLEDLFVDLISNLHPDFAKQAAAKYFFLHYEDFTQNMWFYQFFDILQENNVEVFGLKDLKNFKYSPYQGKFSTSISSGQDWFEVNIEMSYGDEKISLNDIKKAVLNEQKYVQLKDGSVGIIPSEWLKKLEKYFRNGEIKKDKLAISKLRFSIVDELFDQIDDAEVMQELAEKRQRIKTFSEISKVKVPKEIKAELRQYQKEGLNWLNFLDEMHWGGILADDMGLGKTLQVLTLFQHIAKTNKLPNLIVVPTTLLFNWENEIRKFAPKLKAFYHYGPNRVQETEHFKKYDIVFTTYGTLLRDVQFLMKCPFNYLVLDESQAIKNPASRRYKAAVLINAKNRLALTGTPIENSTFDLFAQMNFINPGFFGSVQSFKDNYSNPIDKEGNEIIGSELQRIINPFVLRRTKENVATELPTKTEDVIYCEMESEQRRVYDNYRNSYRDRLLNKIKDEGLGKSKLMVLEALTRLRQICDSPALLKSDEITTLQSIKIKEIVRHIREKTANHKVLIFSQFVGMLTLVREELAKLNIQYEYLDGKSNVKQRENSVNNFQENEKLRVFLISLKAGGTGLNLTSADYVYILDPWWNPAVENQAIDRCYRIGQDKKVFAYRMICKNTVEEKIMLLQAKKKKIASDIIQTDENIMKTINVNDINELFS